VTVEPSVIEETGAIADELRTRTGLSAVAALVVAVFEAIEAGRWPGEDVAGTISEAFEIPQPQVLAEIIALVELGVVQRDRLVLAAATRAALSGRRNELRPGVMFTQGRGTRALEACTAIVVAGGDPRARFATIRDAAPGDIVLCDVDRASVDALVEAAHDAWLRGGLVAIEAGAGELAWIPRVATIRARLAIAVDAASAGEALARLRDMRDATLMMLRPEEQLGPRAAVPAALQPLISTTWKDMRVDAPAHRVVALAGDALPAAHAIAAGHGVPLVRVDVAAAGGISHTREALATHRVVWLDGTAALSPIAAAAVAALIAQSAGLVLVDAGAVPAELRASIEATIEA
jgi:hypothetical protein